jgi:hypothetical protein
VGIFGITMGPFSGRGIDHLVPWYGALIGIIMIIVFQTIQLAAGGLSIGAVVVVAFGIDVSTQIIQVSVTAAIMG